MGGIEFSPEIFTEVCDRIANGESLRKVCKAPDMPNKSSFLRWVDDAELNAKHNLRDQYARAREALADVYAEETVDIADDSTNDTQKDDEGREIVNHDHIARARLRVDARKWAASKMAPKKYGDKLTNEHTGPDGGPVQVQTIERAIVLSPQPKGAFVG